MTKSRRILKLNEPDPGRPARPGRFHRSLLSLGLLVVMGQIVLTLSARHAKRINTYWRYSDSELRLQLGPPVDPVLFRLTEDSFEHPCELLRLEPCPRLTESAVVRAIRNEVSDPRIQVLLEEPYSSGYHLLKRMIIEDEVGAIPPLLKRRWFFPDWYDASLVLRFSYNYFLEPAVRLAELGRDEDALALAATFRQVVGEVAEAGYWLSSEGVDLTDVAILMESFCAGRSILEEEKACTLGMLYALGRLSPSVGDEVGGHRDLWYLLWEGSVSFWESYHSLPPEFRVEELDSYLELANRVITGVSGWEERETLRWLQEGGDESAAAWSYLLGRIYLNQAERAVSIEECATLGGQAVEAFQQVTQQTGESRRFFTQPALHHIRGALRSERWPCSRH